MAKPIYEEVVLSQEEAKALQEALSLPVLQKYFRGVATDIAQSFVLADARTFEAAEYYKHALYGQATVAFIKELLILANPLSSTELGE